jgi:hypothetical protein
MDDSPPQPTDPSPASRWPAIGLLLLRVPIYLFLITVMYVLSIGPMYWYWYESYAMHDSHEEALVYADNVSLFYLPLAEACDRNRHVSDYVNWYLDFWI